MSIVYEPSKTKDSKKTKKEGLEEHLYASPLCVLVIYGNDENSKLFLESPTFLPAHGQSVVLLNLEDDFDKAFIKEHSLPEVPSFIVFVNNGDLEDSNEAEGKKFELNDPGKVYKKKHLIELFDEAYDELDYDDKQTLLSSKEPEEIVDEEDLEVESMDGDEDEEEEEDEDMDGFIECDELEGDFTESSEYSEDEDGDDETTDSDIEDDQNELEAELRQATESSEKLENKMGKNKETHPRYEEYLEIQETIRKIQKDLKKQKKEKVQIEEDKSEWVPVARRLGTRGCKKTKRYQSSDVDGLAMIVAKSLSIKEKDSESSEEDVAKDDVIEDDMVEDDMSEEDMMM